MSHEKQNLAWVERSRQEPPLLSDVHRERMRSRFVDAVRQREEASLIPSRVLPLRPALGFAVAAAAALIMFGLLRPTPQALTGMQVSGSPSGLQEAGWFGQGEVLETFEQVATLRFGDSTIDVKPRSQLISRVVSDAQVVQRLTRGEVVVAYHPDKSAKQKLSIETKSALVDVVGTRFSVRANGAQTDVEVFEGVVRVTPRSGEKARLLRAGERVSVRDERLAKFGSIGAPPAVDAEARLAFEAPAADEQHAQESAASEAPVAPEEVVRDKVAEPEVFKRHGRVARERTPKSAVTIRDDASGNEAAENGPAQAAAREDARDDFVLEVPGGEGLDQPLSLEELEQAKDEAFGREVRKDPASTLDRIATLPSPERKRHLLYRFVRQVNSAEHLGAAWTMVAESWRKQGLARRALEGYRRARRAGRGTAWERHALFESGLIHRSVGEKEKARIAFESYLKLAPDGFRAAQVRQMLRKP